MALSIVAFACRRTDCFPFSHSSPRPQLFIWYWPWALCVRLAQCKHTHTRTHAHSHTRTHAQPCMANRSNWNVHTFPPIICVNSFRITSLWAASGRVWWEGNKGYWWPSQSQWQIRHNCQHAIISITLLPISIVRADFHLLRQAWLARSHSGYHQQSIIVINLGFISH